MKGVASPAPDAAKGPSLPPRRPRLLDCDLIMKGGITSGVVYPRAVVRVAREYQVRNVGGTSVGAIAAAMVAAAECERQRHPDPVAAWDGRLDPAMAAELAGAKRPEEIEGAPGYAGLHGIPAEIGDDLSGRFQPRQVTAPLFDYVFSWIARFETTPGRVLAATLLGLWVPRLIVLVLGVGLFGLIRLFDPTAEGRLSLVVASAIVIAGIIAIRRFAPGLRLPFGAMVVGAAIVALLLGRLVWSLVFADSWAIFAGLWNAISLRDAWRELIDHWDRVLVDVVPLAVVFWVAGAVAYLAWAMVYLLPDHDFGICTGLGDHRAITNWMHATLNRVAGLDDDPSAVLTFGHLERTAITDESQEVKNQRRVGLAMIGTDIRRGVPLSLPDAIAAPAWPAGTPRPANRRPRYLFAPDAFREYFPEPVVRALVEAGERDESGLHAFPTKERLPVVVATRMSMSFPILFSAVPVHYRDSAGVIRPTWISDGGICSNFPSNLFDQSLPPWPTFGIDLVDVPGNPAEIPIDQQHIRRWLAAETPYSHSSETSNPERLPTQPLKGMQAFLMSAVNAARGWIDNSQKLLPGFAERIVAVCLYPGEGGLNLSMDADRIHLLARRGLVAVDRLLADWRPEIEGSQWAHHRWLRMRTLMREMEEVGREWKAWYTVDTAPGGLESFADMTVDMADVERVAGPAYPYPILAEMDRARARLLVERFSAFARQTDYGLGRGDTVQEAGENLGENAAAVVFDAPASPQPNPKLLLMPPFE